MRKTKASDVGGVHGDDFSGFIHRATGFDGVQVIKGQMVKALGEDEDFGDAVAASVLSWGVVAAYAAVRVGRRKAIEVAGKNEPRVGIGKRRAGAFRERTARAFLDGEFRGEEFFAVLNELANWNLKFFAVPEMPCNRHFAAIVAGSCAEAAKDRVIKKARNLTDLVNALDAGCPV